MLNLYPQAIDTRFFGRPAHSRITMPDGQVVRLQGAKKWKAQQIF